MPPKKKAPEPSKKTDIKKKEKIIEDKTFGLKNKKGAKTQKFIQQVQHQVKQGNQSARKAELAKVGDKKIDKKKEIDELNTIFKPVQKVEKGADPKSVLCAFYKQGQCTKGDKCKFSHDLSLERKSEKRNMYVDMRDNEEGNEDLMENWDEEKLKEVVEKKHGENERKMPKTDIICKFFLDALENNKYGWFWECPNGAAKCHYRHALPPGFVLKKDKKKEEKSEQISIEDLVEKQDYCVMMRKASDISPGKVAVVKCLIQENPHTQHEIAKKAKILQASRANLGNNLTKITFETFQQWKKKKLKEKQDISKKEEDRKRAEYKAGRHVGLSGRDMFTFNPEMATDDMTEEGEAAFDMGARDEEDEEENVPIKDISSEFLISNLDNVEGGTVASVRHWESKEASAAGGATVEANKDAVPIDENLFDEDLDDLDEELSELNVEEDD